MPSVHGHLKISLIGKPGALARVEDVTPVMHLLIELGKAMPELEIESVCRVAGAITDVKCLFTVVKVRESNGWACPIWQNIDMAGAVLDVKFPEKARCEETEGWNE